MGRDLESGTSPVGESNYGVNPAPAMKVARELTAREVAGELLHYYQSKTIEFTRLVDAMPGEMAYPADKALRVLLQRELSRVRGF